jgi:3-phenylpropionate/trans-cinnamate dioxygenase ferredoxin component
MSNLVKVAKTYDVPNGEVRSFIVENEIIAVFNVKNEFFALKDQCSHMDLPLSDGLVEGSKVICAYHGAEFDISTGNALSLPAIESVERYDVKIDGDDIYIDI